MSIKLEHVVLASPEQMEFIIEGMRNPMNSWNKTDSFNGCETYNGIDSNPKQGVKVKIGTTVCLRYITAEVIEESQKIFDDSVRIKQEAKEQKAAEKQEKKERLKESVSETMDSAKSGLEKIFKKDRKAIETEKGEK